MKGGYDQCFAVVHKLFFKLLGTWHNQLDAGLNFHCFTILLTQSGHTPQKDFLLIPIGIAISPFTIESV